MTFESQHRAQITIILTAYLGLAVAATATNFLYYADSAFFAFALASGHGWELVISESPRRIAALSLTGLPAMIAHALGASLWLGGKLYQATFYAIPLIGLALIRAFAKGEAARNWQAWSLISLASLGMSSFGFPTEAWVTLALFWPTLASLKEAPTNSIELAGAIVVGWLFIFSHEIAVMCLPAFFIVAQRTWLAAKETPRVRMTILMAAYGLAIAVWAWLYIAFTPKNPMFAHALKSNSAAFFAPHFFESPMMAMGMVIMAFALASAYSPRLTSNSITRAVIIGLAIMIGAVDTFDNDPIYRYGARTAMCYFLMFMPFIFARLTTPPRPQIWLLAPAAIVFFPINAYALYGWSQYCDLLTRQTTAEPRKSSITDANWLATINDKLPHQAAYYLHWSTPYLQILLRGNEFEPSIPFIDDKSEKFEPMTCGQAISYISGSPYLSADSGKALTKQICDHDPARERTLAR